MENFSKSYYSDEIVEEILSGLPPKSLMRFQCVCTMWCNLIKSPSFVAKHLASSKRASRMPILFKHPILRNKDNNTKDEKEVENDDDDREILLSSLNIIDENDDDSLLSSIVVEGLNVPDPGPLKLNYSSDLTIAGHYDGIICLKLFIGNVILCNPAMKEFKLLPKSFLLLPNDDDYEDLEFELRYYTEHLGFGYDPKGKDYKVVRYVIYEEACYWFKAEVYTMKSNSWREIKTPKYSDIPIADKMTTVIYCSPDIEPIYLNGICYWNVHGYCHRADTDGCEDFILSFDMGNDQFDEISIPDLPDECGVVKLALWKEFISIFTCHQSIEYPQSYDMWVMMDDLGDGKRSWRKQLTIGPVEGDIRPLLFWKSDQLLMVTKTDGHIVLYDIGTQKYLRIQYSKRDVLYSRALPYINSIILSRDEFYIQALPYVNSMVSIDGGSVLEDIHFSAFYGSKLYSSRGEEVDT